MRWCGDLGLTSMRSWACSAAEAAAEEVGCADSTPIAAHARNWEEEAVMSRYRRLRLMLLFPFGRRRSRCSYFLDTSTVDTKRYFGLAQNPKLYVNGL